MAPQGDESSSKGHSQTQEPCIERGYKISEQISYAIMQLMQITHEPIVTQPDPSTAKFRYLTLQNANIEHKKNRGKT